MAVIPLAGAPISFYDASLSFWDILLVRRDRMPPNASMNRRQFLQSTALAAAAGTFLPLNALPAAEKPPGVSWPIGCFNRPWLGEKANAWNYETALDGIKAAGYKLTGMLTRTAKEPFIGSDATPEYLAELKQKIAARSLKVNMGALRVKSNLPLGRADQGHPRADRQREDDGRRIPAHFRRKRRQGIR